MHSFKHFSVYRHNLSYGDERFDLKDEFDLGDTIINGVEDNEFIDLENYSKFNLEGDNSIWIFEVFKYQDVKYNIVNKNLDLIYSSIWQIYG